MNGASGWLWKEPRCDYAQDSVNQGKKEHLMRNRASEIQQRKLRAALAAWRRWYGARLGRIAVRMDRGEPPQEDYSGYEQDLFEALGCRYGDSEDDFT
jgi:hypothetical protein